MTRIEKYKEIRNEIQNDNDNERFYNPLGYYRIIVNQKKIKREGGYKH